MLPQKWASTLTWSGLDLVVAKHFQAYDRCVPPLTLWNQMVGVFLVVSVRSARHCPKLHTFWLRAGSISLIIILLDTCWNWQINLSGLTLQHCVLWPSSFIANGTKWLIPCCLRSSCKARQEAYNAVSTSEDVWFYRGWDSKSYLSSFLKAKRVQLKRISK